MCRRWGTPQIFLLLLYGLRKTWKIRILKKKNADVIILHMCTKSYNHMKYSSWDTELDRIFSVILGYFLSFYPPTPYQPRKPKFWKNETSIWRCHPFKLVQQKIRSYDVYLLRHAVRHIKFFVIQIIFCSFTLLRTSKLTFGKMEKTPGDIILLHMCTINQDHMMYRCWNIKCKGLRFCCHFG